MGVIIRLGLKGGGATLHNLEGIDKRLRQKHKEGLYEGAKRIEKAAKAILQSRVNPRYSTGKLGGSIHTTFNPTEPQPYARVGPDMRIAPYCLPKGNDILTNKGLKDVSEVEKGDFVYQGDGYEPVKEVFTSDYSGNLYKITRKYCRIPIVTTDTHPLLILRPTLCSHTTDYDYFCRKNCKFHKQGKHKYCDEPYKKYKLEWVFAKDLTTSDFVADFQNTRDKRDCKNKLKFVVERLGGGNQYKASHIVSTPVSLEVTNDLCRLAGYYAAEGSLDKKNYVRFHFNVKERKFHQDVRNLMLSIFGVKDSKPQRKGDGYSLVFCSRKANTFFREFIGKGAENKTVSFEFHNKMSRDNIKNFLVGLINGDGFNTDYEVRLTTVSKELAYIVYDMFKTLGIKSSIRIRKGGKVNILGKWYNAKPAYILSVRSTKAPFLLKTPINNSGRVNTTNLVSNLFLYRVERIEKKKVDNEKVYNFEVGEKKYYNILGFTLHNSEWVEFGHFMVGGWGGGGGRWWEGHHYMRDAFLQEKPNIMSSIEADLANELKCYPYVSYNYRYEMTYWGPRARSITTGQWIKGI